MMECHCSEMPKRTVFMSRTLPACCAALLLALPASLPGAVADISLTKSVSATSVPVGTALTYTLMVHNAGPDDAQNIVLVDLVPAVATLVSMQSDFATCTQSADTITCRLDTLTNGGTATLMLSVIPTSAGTICNLARVTSAQTDPDFSNNKASVCATVTKATSGADLSVSQVAMPDPIPAGGNVTYTIRVHNNGPEAATNLRLTDTLPTNTTFVSASPDCVNDGGIVSCTIPKLNKNGTATKTIVVSAPGTGQVCNAVSVLASGDASTEHNSDALCSLVTATPPVVHDFAVVKITAPPSVVLSAKKASITKMVNVQIQNRSPQNETINTLDSLVTLTVESLGLCPDLVPVLRSKPPQKKLPVILKPKQTLNVYFDVTFTTNCVNDHLKSSKSDPGHADYRYHAAVHHEAIDGIPDTHPSDDTGPRSVQAPSELEPNPDGKIQDRGVGGLKSDHTFGADVLTDVIALSDSAVNSPTNTPPPATNRPPIAVNDTAFTTATAPVDIPVLANDSDPDGDLLSITAVTQPANGTVSFATNVATYTAHTNFTGTNTFQYTISDGRGGAATATVSVTVTNPAIPPPVWETSEIGAVWSDNFNRATLGPNWIVPGPSVNASIVSNELMFAQTSLNNSRQVYYDPWQICSDSWTIRWSQRFGVLDANSRGVGVGIKNFQAAGGNDRGYNGLLVGAGSDLGQMQIQRFDGSQQVSVAAGTAMSLATNQVVDCSLTRSGWTITATASNRATMQVSTASITFSDAANLIAPTISRMCFYPLRGTVYVDDVSFTMNHRKPARFIIVGASISDGYNASVYEKTYGRVVQSNFTQVVCNDSSSYNSTSNSVSVMPEILAHQPGTAVLMIGGNDLLFGYPATQWQSQYSNLVAQLQANGVKVKHCLNTPRSTLDLTPLNDWILSTYPTNDVIDTWTPLLQGAYSLNPAYDGDGTHPPDGVHPNDAGHLVIGQTIRNKLQ
jgi:uncharacterized repeat protein (TIGR01451 family)